MSRSLDRWFDETIDIMQTPLKKRMQRDGIYLPLVPPPSSERFDMTVIQ